MVRGIFARAEQDIVLATFKRFVVYVTSDTIEPIILNHSWDRSAWDLANLYLLSVGAKLLGEPLYRQVGVHNGPTIKPLELRVGIVEQMTPDMARIVGALSAEVGSRGVTKTLQVTGLVPPSRAPIARLWYRYANRSASEASCRSRTSRYSGAHTIGISAHDTVMPMEVAMYRQPSCAATPTRPK